MPHDCMAFSYFIRYQLDDGAAFGGLPSVTHIDQTHSSNTPIYITAAQVKHNGDRSPDVPRDADPIVYASLHQCKSSLDDDFLYRLVFD